MNKLNKLSLIMFLLVNSLGWSQESSQLRLDTEYDLFKGDWLDTWKDPKDERFIKQGIDVRKSFEEATSIREDLYNLRQKYIEQFNVMSKLPEANYFQLEKDITKGTIDFIVKYLDRAKPANVQKSEMAFVGFGSMARGEAGIVTDLEGTLLWDKNVLDKDSLGLVFGQALSNVLDGLIGHPIYGIRGFRLDEADHSPFHRAPWARFMSLSEAFCKAVKSLPNRHQSKEMNEFRKSYYYPFEGSWVYTGGTPESLANLVAAGCLDSWPSMWSTNIKESDFNTEWYKWAKPVLTQKFIQEGYVAKVLEDSTCGENLDQSQIDRLAKSISLRLQSDVIATIGNFPQLSRNRAFIYGNKELFYEFEDGRNKILNANGKYLRKKLAFKYLDELIDYISGDKRVGIASGRAPDTVDIKRYNYRFEEQLYTNLAFLLDLDLQNQGDIIKYLTDNGIFGKNFGKFAWKRVNQIIRLRLKKQIALQSQLGKNMQFMTEKAYEKKLQEIKSKIAKNKSIVKNSSDNMKKLAAKSSLIELEADLQIMPKLFPGRRDSIFTPEDIVYIRKNLFPEQASVLKRLRTFLKDNEDMEKLNFDAFQDSR